MFPTAQCERKDGLRKGTIEIRKRMPEKIRAFFFVKAYCAVDGGRALRYNKAVSDKMRVP